MREREREREKGREGTKWGGREIETKEDNENKEKSEERIRIIERNRPHKIQRT